MQETCGGSAAAVKAKNELAAATRTIGVRFSEKVVVVVVVFFFFFFLSLKV